MYNHYLNVRKGTQFTKRSRPDKRYVVLDYDLSHVYLVKLDHPSIPYLLPLTRVRTISYKRLNKKYDRY